MQFDLLQSDLFSADEAPTDDSKKPKTKSQVSPRPVEATEVSKLPPLPDSLLSALSQPPGTEFHDDPELDVPEVAGMQKSPDALKTISEASALLDVPQHVLRFWESRFPQIKPVKSRGGRRYYRTEDMQILETIKNLLYKQGYTIKGAKKAFSQMKKAEAQPVQLSSKAAEALSFDAVFAKMPPREALSPQQISELSALRKELAALRDALKLHL